MKLPAFKMTDQNGNIITEEALKGKRTILYFYPRDNTPTCTTQAVDFTNHLEELRQQGIQVYGVNGDSMKKHQNFIAKHDIGFDLLVDEDYKLAKELDIYKMKKVFGKESMGIVRTTLLVGQDLQIEKRIDNVKVKNQLTELLDK
ncbi:peroxiredoxin [Macrococcus hajekii]|nr:peroxiredoxin [Macrococcus hajekii]